MLNLSLVLEIILSILKIHFKEDRYSMGSKVFGIAPLFTNLVAKETTQLAQLNNRPSE